MSTIGIGRHTGTARTRTRLLAAVALAAIPAATTGPEPAPAATDRPASSALAGYDFGAVDARRLELQGRLREVSGLAIDARGGLRAHNDERATIYRVDLRTGRADASFDIGRNGARGDFEGIAMAGSRVFLVTSDGKIVEAPDGSDGQTVDYAVTETPSGPMCDDIEGLEYDPPGNALLLACKTPDRDFRGRLIVLRFSLRTRSLDTDPFVSVPLDALEAFDIDPELSPSGIAIHPVTGTLLVIAARERVIVELDRSGRLIAAAGLRGRYHDQAEGIAIQQDGTLIIADEGGSGDASLTFYPYRPGTE